MDGFSKRKDRLRRNVLELRHQFVQGKRSVFAGVVPVDEFAEVIARECGQFRERVYAPLTTLWLFIEQVLCDDRACQDAVCRHLAERVARWKSVRGQNTGAYGQARQRLPLSVPGRLYRSVAFPSRPMTGMTRSSASPPPARGAAMPCAPRKSAAPSTWMTVRRHFQRGGRRSNNAST